ncbi:MAG: diguanylate cyclase, partial [Thermoguttaceae bacterium]|nr:diguanylate cyclase [Thermoguttaceae bacterium]
MLKNLVLAAVIIGISFLVGNIFIKILLIIIGLANAAVGALLYWYNMLSFDAKVYSRIYDDHIEHSQRIGFSKRYLHADIEYSDIEKSEQDNRGNLIVHLKNDHGAKLYTTDENGDDRQDFALQDNSVTLKFADTKAKLTLVNDLYGHDMGDRILIRFAELIREAVHEDDPAGRLGGDEFVAFLKNTM